MWWKRLWQIVFRNYLDRSWMVISWHWSVGILIQRFRCWGHRNLKCDEWHFIIVKLTTTVSTEKESTNGTAFSPSNHLFIMSRYFGIILMYNNYSYLPRKSFYIEINKIKLPLYIYILILSPNVFLILHDMTFSFPFILFIVLHIHFVMYNQVSISWLRFESYIKIKELESYDFFRILFYFIIFIPRLTKIYNYIII